MAAVVTQAMPSVHFSAFEFNLGQGLQGVVLKIGEERASL